MSTPCKISAIGSALLSPSPGPHPPKPSSIRPIHYLPFKRPPLLRTADRLACKATEVSKVEEEEPKAPAAPEDADDQRNWVPVVPLSALPKGERRVIIQDNETILLLWYKDQVLAIENRSPAEGAYSEGLLNAKLTQVPILPSFLYPIIYNKKNKIENKGVISLIMKIYNIVMFL